MVKVSGRLMGWSVQRPRRWLSWVQIRSMAIALSGLLELSAMFFSWCLTFGVKWLELDMVNNWL